MALQASVAQGFLFFGLESIVLKHLVGFLDGGSPIARLLLTQNNTNRESTQISMFRLGFKPTMPFVVRNAKICLTEFVDS